MHSNKTLPSILIAATAPAAAVVINCVRQIPTEYAAVLALLTLPNNILLSKVLFQKLRHKIPRHKILLSLTISDFVQIMSVAFFQALGILLELTTDMLSCQFMRKATEALLVVTVIINSGSMIALAIERYVSCFHCLQIRTILSEKRVNRALITIWVFGVICALADWKLYVPNLTSVVVPLTKTFDVLYTFAVIGCSAVISYVQIRLYDLSRQTTKAKLTALFGCQAEARDLQRVQLRISFVASAVIWLYVVCMCPLAAYIIITGFEDPYQTSTARLVCFFMTQFNAFIEPVIYGMGMRDTRRAMKKEVKKAVACFSKRG